jgi:hypothetical protein
MCSAWYSIHYAAQINVVASVDFRETLLFVVSRAEAAGCNSASGTARRSAPPFTAAFYGGTYRLDADALTDDARRAGTSAGLHCSTGASARREAAQHSNSEADSPRGTHHVRDHDQLPKYCPSTAQVRADRSRPAFSPLHVISRVSRICRGECIASLAGVTISGRSAAHGWRGLRQKCRRQLRNILGRYSQHCTRAGPAIGARLHFTTKTCRTE